MESKIKRKAKINYFGPQKILFTIFCLLFILALLTNFAINLTTLDVDKSDAYGNMHFGYISWPMAIILWLLSISVFVLAVMQKRVVSSIISFIVAGAIIYTTLLTYHDLDTYYTDIKYDDFRVVGDLLVHLGALILTLIITIFQPRKGVFLKMKIDVTNYVKKQKELENGDEKCNQLRKMVKVKDFNGIVELLSPFAVEQEKEKMIKYYEKEEIDENNGESRFVGTTFSYFFHLLLWKFLMIITFRLAYPFVIVMQEKYLAKRTYTSNNKNEFDGNGAQLIGKYILWLFLSIITFGIFYIVLAARVIKWKVSHTHFEESEIKESHYDGSGVVRFFLNMGLAILTIITLTLAYPFKIATMNRYDAKHMIVDKNRLKFTGTAMQYIGRHIAWTLLSIITFGIYYMFVPLRKQKWIRSHIIIDTDATIGEDENYGSGKDNEYSEEAPIVDKTNDDVIVGNDSSENKEETIDKNEIEEEEINNNNNEEN